MTEATESANAGNSAENAGANNQAADWTSEFDDTQKGYLQNKGWEKPGHVLEGYQNLEKLLGADKAGRAIVPPKDDAPDEEWRAFHKKLGAPETVEGYQLPDTMKDDKLAQEFRNVAFKHGMKPGTFSEILSWVQQTGQSKAEGDLAQFEQQQNQDEEALKGEWGNDYGKNMALAQRAARMFTPGEAAEQKEAFLNSVIGAVGVKTAYQFFNEIGKGMSEATFHSDSGGANNFGTSREGAQAKIQELKSNAEWSKKYLGGDQAAQAEMNRLRKIAAGEV